MRVNCTPHRLLIFVGLFAVSLQSKWREQIMLDLFLLALAAGLFALTIGYAVACDRL